MKLAVVGTKGLPEKSGGVEKVISRLVREYSKNNIEVTVYSRYSYSEIREKEFNYFGVKVRNVRTIPTKRLDTISYSIIACLYAAISDVDIVAIHQSIPGIFNFIPKLFGKKVVLHNHGLEYLGYKWNKIDKILMKILMRLTASLPDTITTISISQLEECKKIYNRYIIYIPNGIDLPPKSNESNQRENYILFVGRIVPDKGIEVLIRSFLKVNTYHKNIMLYIVGKDSFSEDYVKSIKELASQCKNIFFLGEKLGNELYNLYERAKFVVIPSKIESFSHVLMEALWLNGVVLCSDIPQFKVFVKDYVVFFKKDDENDLAEKIINLLTDENLRAKLIQKSKTFPFQSYSWENVAKKYINLYTEILKK